MISITAERFGELLAAEARLAEVEYERDGWRAMAESAENVEYRAEAVKRYGQMVRSLAAVEALCDEARENSKDDPAHDPLLREQDVRAAVRGEG